MTVPGCAQCEIVERDVAELRALLATEIKPRQGGRAYLVDLVDVCFANTDQGLKCLICDSLVADRDDCHRHPPFGRALCPVERARVWLTGH